MTRGKASTSAWGRPGSPQRPIGTYEVKDLRREAGASGSAEVGAAHVAWQPSTRGRATARGRDNCGHLLACYNHAKQRAHQLCPSQRPALRCPALNRAGVTLVAMTRIDELDLPARRPRMDDGRVVGQQTVEN